MSSILKRIFLFTAVLVSAMTVNAQSAILRSGTNVPVSLMSSIYSQDGDKSNYTGYSAVVAADILDVNGENVLISRGTPVVVVANVKRARGFGKPGKIDMSFISTYSIDGQIINLAGNYSQCGDDRRGIALGTGLGIGLTVGCPELLLLLCIKGERIEIPANTILNSSSFVTNNYTIKLGGDASRE